MKFQPRELTPHHSVRDLFGAELRYHREKAGMSLRQLSDVLKYSKSQLARYEAGEALPYDDLPAMLDACFGTNGLFVRLHAAAKKEPFPSKYRRALEIEAQATVIEQYLCATAPGLLQTPAYADRLMRIGQPNAPDAEIAALVKARMDRQPRLYGPEAPRCWFILDEAVLRRPVGGADVMRSQLMSLIENGTKPQITIQVLPFEAGEHPALGGSLNLYSHPKQQVAYLEGIRCGQVFDDPKDVAERRDNYDLLRAMALSPRDSEAMIRAAMEDCTPCEAPRT
ncbi:helix-turn-helix domain-containing protein [Streptomyces palmae]|uniref:XRE family transcriptional regulator n=1 Tax=Streptomyces palmae TaxID=1701085 RepID=A0A4Z0GSN3_9ACTN|nr:helix-turn-helix transcriptional regulator [Streptomyces palmae]TGA99698.1 XRE family transcriptional regulator [Streptomyces palmae]